MKDNNIQEKNDTKLKILELERLYDKYMYLHCFELITLEMAMPDVCKTIRLYEKSSKKLKEEIVMFTFFPFIMSIALFAMTMIEYGYITNRLINYTLAFFAAYWSGYVLNAVSSKESRKDIKKTIEAFKYVKEHQQEYKIAKKKAKQYKEETIPNKECELKVINDLLVQQLELIKKTTNLIADDKKCCDEYGECNFGLLYDILDKHNHSQEEPKKNISKVKNLSGIQTNFKVRKLTRKSTDI